MGKKWRTFEVDGRTWRVHLQVRYPADAGPEYRVTVQTDKTQPPCYVLFNGWTVEEVARSARIEAPESIRASRDWYSSRSALSSDEPLIAAIHFAARQSG